MTSIDCEVTTMNRERRRHLVLFSFWCN